MSATKKMKLTVVISEDTYQRISYLKGVYGIIGLKEFWNFCMSLVQLVTKGILEGKKLALYDPTTDTVEIIVHEKITDLEKARDEGN